MPLGEGRHPHAEVAKGAHQPDELIRVSQAVRVLDPLPARASPGIPPQGKDRADPGSGVLGHDRAEVLPAGTDAGEVGDLGQGGVRGQFGGDAHRAIACRSAGAVGQRDEGGLQGLQLAHRLPQQPLPLVGLRRRARRRSCDARSAGLRRGTAIDIRGMAAPYATVRRDARRRGAALGLRGRPSRRNRILGQNP
jgi:hypothetical protein